MTDYEFTPPYEDSFEELREEIFTYLSGLYSSDEVAPTQREGDLAWTMASTAANMAARIYEDLNENIQLSFAQYSRGEYLDLIGATVGLDRNAATAATGTVRFMGDDGTIVASGTQVSSSVTDPDDEPQAFATTEEGTIAELSDPASAPIAGLVLGYALVVQEGSATQNEIVDVNISANATGGTFTLTIEGETTAATAYNASTATLQANIEALPSMSAGDVVVTGSAGDYTLEFQNTFANTDMDVITVDSSSLTGSGAGNLNGDAVYKFIYVTNLNSSTSDRGYTAPSSATSTISPSSEQVEVSVPPLAWSPENDALDVSEVRVYRSYMPISDITFSEYKYIGSITTNPKLGGLVEDNVSDADFLLIDDSLEGVGAITTVNTTGLVDVSADAVTAGSAGNVAAGSIVLLETETPGVDVVTNPSDMEGGADEQSDEAYRTRILERAGENTGAGNIFDYIRWAKEIDGIANASVTPLWDGPGTVKVVVSGSGNSTITDADKIEEVREYIAGTIAIENPTGSTLVATPQTTGGTMAAATYEYTYTFVNSEGGETEPDPTYVEAVTTTGTSSVDLSVIPVGPTGTGAIGVTRRRIYRRNMDDATPTWAYVTEIEDNTTTTYTDTTPDGSLPALATPSGDTLTARAIPTINSTSLFDGVAPIGAHITVATITPLEIYVTATVVPEEGYTLSGEIGKTDLAATLNTNLEDYIENLAPGEDVYYKHIENVIHDTAGVADFRDVLLYATGYAGVSTNIVVDSEEAPQYDSASTTWTEATS